MRLALLAVILTPLPHDCCQTSLTGESSVGVFTQEGSRVTVVGETWLGVGTIRGNMLRINWTRLGGDDAEAFIGIYKIDGRTLTGHYGRVSRVEVFEWDICGDGLMSETITVR